MRNNKNIRRLVTVLPIGLAMACTQAKTTQVDGEKPPHEAEAADTASRGLVIVHQADHSTVETQHTTTHGFAARFAAADSCATETIAACVVRDCSGVDKAEAAPHAGPIMVSGGDFPALADPSATGTYRTIGGAFGLWSGGEPLLVAAEGGDVPAFSAAVDAPSGVELTSPLLGTPPYALRVFRTHLLPVTWVAPETGAGSEVHVVIASGQISIDCTVDAAAEQARIEPEVLSRLPAGDGSFTVEVRNSTTVEVDGWLIDVVAQHTAVLPTGEIGFGVITLE